MPFPTSTSASDVWSLKSLYVAIAGDNWPVLSLPDPNFNRVSLLLNGDGPDGGQNNTYTDSSSNGYTITPAGAIEQGSVSPFGDNWSNYFGAGEKIYTGQSSGLAFGTGDFTIETWVYRQADIEPYSRICHFGPYWNNNDSVGLNFDDGDFPNKITFASYRLGGRLLVSTTSVVSGQWYHVAVTRESGTFKLWINGVLEDTDTTAGATEASSTNLICVASTYNRDVDEDFDGFISNLRVVKGTAVYTADFDPPTEPLTAISGTQFLFCQSNYFVDNSTNALAFTIAGTPKVTPFSPFLTATSITLADNGGSGYFSGGVGGDALTAATTGTTIGTGDFTIEGWFYFNGIGPGTVYTLLDGRTGADTSNLMWAQEGSGSWTIFNGAGSTLASGWTSSTFTTGQWYHIAQTRTGGTSRFFVNGVLTGSPADSSNYDSQQYTIGGRYAPNGSNLTGYLSNFRIVAGTALYTANFTPPTAPLTNITNTYLLLNFADAAIFDYAAINNVNTTGNADISTSVVKYGTGSLAFDGTGDWLQIDDSSIFAFGTSDFTIEMWVYNTTNSPTYAVLWDTRDSEPDDSSHIVLNLGKPSWWYNGAARIQPATAPAINTWYHLAVARSGTSTKMFIDGTQVGSTYSDSNDYKANDYARIGSASDNPSGLNYFNGYIDDLRITNGLARYTANFTPPTAALPTF